MHAHHPTETVYQSFGIPFFTNPNTSLMTSGITRTIPSGPELDAAPRQIMAADQAREFAG